MTTLVHMCANGMSLAPATDAEIEHVERNFRPGDRHEQEVAGAAGTPTRVDDFEDVWTVRIRGRIIGYVGVCVMPDVGSDAPVRGLCFMSCTETDRNRIAFVKDGREAMRFVVSQTPEHVETFLAWPLASYGMSVKWQKRILGFREAGRCDSGTPGEVYVVLETTRREVMNG